MIQASELRIGNWYNCANPMEGGRLYPNQFTAWTEYLDFEAYGEPIPLTPEILEKAGFKLDDGSDMYGSDDDGCEFYRIDGSFTLSYHKEYGVRKYFQPEDGFYAWHGSKMKSLHQLQNIYFSLTGTELQVNL